MKSFFRTAKQALGIGDCQSINKEIQNLHIHNSMLAYVALEHVKNSNQKKSVEDILNVLRFQKSTPQANEYIDSIGSFVVS